LNFWRNPSLLFKFIFFVVIRDVTTIGSLPKETNQKKVQPITWSRIAGLSANLLLPTIDILRSLPRTGDIGKSLRSAESLIRS